MNPDLEKRVPREILEELIEEGTEAFRGILEKLFNVAMQVERSEFLGAEAYERTASRRGYRNGFKGKRIQTRVGELRLEIPQVRGLSFYPKSLERGCRSEKALKLAIAEMYVMGVSTRKATEVTEQLCGLEISATQVSRVAGMLDEELEEFRNRELGEYPIVYLDAHYEKVRKGGRVQDVAILKALGVNRFGTREVLGLSARLSEAEVHWREFMAELQKRGLKGVELFVSDDHSGLKAARRAVYPSVPWNRRGGPHRLDHLAAFLRWTPQFLLPPVREILRGGEPEGKVPLGMFFQASVHLLRRRPSVRRVRSLAVV